MAENQYQNTNQQPTTQPADNGDQGGGKMFTQEEVNQIVSERLRREREKSTPQPKDERETALQEREKAVAAKESMYRCREYLAGLNMKEEFRAGFLEALDTSDFDGFKKVVDVLGKYFTTTTVERSNHTPANPILVKHTVNEALVSAAFKPKT